MKKKILILCGVLIFILLGISSVVAQDPNDPGNPDTLWIERINMDKTLVMGMGKPFTVKCSVYTDNYVQAFKIPLTFYHARNTEVYIDSVYYYSWVPVGTAMTSIVKHNSTVGDTAKTFLFAMLWVNDSIPPTRAVLCTLKFHTPTFSVWDTSKSIILDTCIYKPPPTGSKLEFVTPTAKTYKPVFVPGAIGYPQTISGKVSGVTLPASVFVSGDRKKAGKTDASGVYSFVVGRGGKWIVFRDSSVARYTFDSLLVDKSGINFVGTSDVREVVLEKMVLPEAFSLDQNYPNPFNPNTMIRFSLPKDCWVKLEVYNLLGQKVKTLVDQMLLAGTKEVVWDGKNQAGALVSSGIYFYRIQTKDFTDIKKMVLVK